MADAIADPGIISGYHAHLYYAPETRPIAERLRAAIGENFPQARIGSWHDEPVGPHPVAMYQVAFGVEEFPRLVPWLMLNREGLDVLVEDFRVVRARRERVRRRPLMVDLAQVLLRLDRIGDVAQLDRKRGRDAARPSGCGPVDPVEPAPPGCYIRPRASRTIMIISNKPSPLLG